VHRSYEREIDEIQMAEELFTVGAARSLDRLGPHWRKRSQRL